MKDAKSKSLDTNSDPDRNRLATNGQRLARLLNVLQLIQSAKKYDAKALAKQLGRAARRITRILKILECARIPINAEPSKASLQIEADALRTGYRKISLRCEVRR